MIWGRLIGVLLGITALHDVCAEEAPLWEALVVTYGSLEGMIRGIRDHRPLDLNAEQWRRAHPEGTFEGWRQDAHRCLLKGLHYDPGPLDLRAEVLGREERPEFVLERVAFNTAPNASMVVSTSEDPLFPPEGQQEAARQIEAGYRWAGCPEKFRHFFPQKPHCYDAEVQAEAMGWFDRHLKG